jgi:hypothetical protein
MVTRWPPWGSLATAARSSSARSVALGLAQPVGRVLQDGVAGRVAMRVVDRLEMVDVGDDEADRRLVICEQA